MPKSANANGETSAAKSEKSPRTNPKDFQFVVMRSNKPTFCADKDAVIAALKAGRAGGLVGVFELKPEAGLETTTNIVGL